MNRQPDRTVEAPGLQGMNSGLAGVVFRAGAEGEPVILPIAGAGFFLDVVRLGLHLPGLD